MRPVGSIPAGLFIFLFASFTLPDDNFNSTRRQAVSVSLRAVRDQGQRFDSCLKFDKFARLGAWVGKDPFLEPAVRRDRNVGEQVDIGNEVPARHSVLLEQVYEVLPTASETLYAVKPFVGCCAATTADRVVVTIGVLDNGEHHSRLVGHKSMSLCQP